MIIICYAEEVTYVAEEKEEEEPTTEQNIEKHLDNRMPENLSCNQISLNCC